MLDENVAHFIVKSQHNLSQKCEAVLKIQSILTSKSIKRNASVRYERNPQVTQVLEVIGMVVESVTDPSFCSVDSLNDIRCGFVNRFEVVTRNSEKEPCVTCLGSIDVQIQDSRGIKVEKEVSQSDTGKYTVVYQGEVKERERVTPRAFSMYFMHCVLLKKQEKRLGMYTCTYIGSSRSTRFLRRINILLNIKWSDNHW